MKLLLDQLLTVVVPSVGDLLIPKLKRGEPRDIKHAEWANSILQDPAG